MPTSTKAQKQAYSRWNAKANRIYTVKIRKDTGIPNLLDRAIAESGESANSWIQKAIVEKLRNEGKLQ